MATTYTKVGATAEMDDLFAAQLDSQYPKGSLINVIAKEKPAIAVMLERKDTTKLAGSQQIQIKFSTSRNPNGGWVEEGEPLSTDDFEHTVTQIYWPKFLAYSVRWTQEQKRINRGAGKLFSIIDEKIENTKEALMNDLSTGFWGSGANNQMDGIQKMIPAQTKATQTASTNTIGGQAISLDWNQTYGINMTGESSITMLEKRMLNAFNTIQTNKGKCDYIFCDQTTHETYETNARDFITTSPVKIADITFDLCKYKGTPMIYDEKAPAGEMRFVNAKQLLFCTDPEWWMKWSEWQQFLNLPWDDVKHIICVCNLVRLDPRGLACIFNIAE